jgi:hypothetical protein
VVDLSPAAITARLREMGALLARRGRLDKGPDMTGPAITARLRMLGTLSDACRRLGRARLSPGR